MAFYLTHFYDVFCVAFYFKTTPCQIMPCYCIIFHEVAHQHWEQLLNNYFYTILSQSKICLCKLFICKHQNTQDI